MRMGSSQSRPRRRGEQKSLCPCPERHQYILRSSSQSPSHCVEIRACLPMQKAIYVPLLFLCLAAGIAVEWSTAESKRSCRAEMLYRLFVRFTRTQVQQE